MLIIKQTGHEADYSKWGTMVRLKQTMHEADQSNKGALAIIKQRRHEADHTKGEFGNYKADHA